MDDQIDDLLEYDAEKAPSSQINHMQLDSNGEPDSTAGKSELFKAQFPQARIKTIMKSDPLVNNVTLDGVYAVAVATEMFLELLVRDAHQYTLHENRKIVSYKDICSAVSDVYEFEFLMEIVPQMMEFKEALALHENYNQAKLQQAELENALGS